MSNWFENNQSKSVISYTLVIIGATWAVSTFVLQDNRLSLARAELDSQKTVAEQYKAKVELLQRELDTVRAENVEYRAWLGQMKEAIPVIIPRITELKARIGQLESENGKLTASGSVPPPVNSETSVTRGRAYVDSATGLVVTVLEVRVDRTAKVAIKFPEKPATEEQTVYPGRQWPFAVGDKSYILTLLEVIFYSDSVKIQVAEQRK